MQGMRQGTVSLLVPLTRVRVKVRVSLTVTVTLIRAEFLLLVHGTSYWLHGTSSSGQRGRSRVLIGRAS